MARYPRVFGSPAAKAQSRAAFSAAGGFFPVLDAALGGLIESNIVTLTNVGSAVPLTISGGSYSKNGGAYSTTATTVSDGDTLRVRVTAPSTNSATATATVSVNSIARSFSVTTAAPSTGTPTLTLSATSPSIASNAAAGTLVSNISNVPAGATPTVTPNDGRLVIAGDSSAGWKVVVGMSALSAGTVNFSVAATGATGASGVLTVTAAGPVFTTFPAYATLALAGDSYGQAVNATTTANGYANLVANGIGATLTNSAVSGSVLQNSPDASGSPRTGNLRDNVQAFLLGANKKAAAIVAVGFNDARYIGASGVFNVANYLNDYIEVVNALILGGYSRSDIYLVTPWFITDAGLNTGSTGFSGQTREAFLAFPAAVRQVATDFGTKFIDAYTPLSQDAAYTSNVNANDNVHPTNYGHSLIAQVILNQVQLLNSGVTPTVALSVSGQTLTSAITAVGGAVSYEHRLLSNAVEVASSTTGVFASAASGTYYAKARPVFADGSKGPWGFSGSATVAGAARTARGQTESYAATADNTLLSATTPAQGAWTQNAYSTGTAAIGTNAVRGPATASQLAVYHIASQAYGNGQFGEMALTVRSNTAGLLSEGIVLRSDPASQNYLVAFYNGQSIRAFKCVDGVLQQIGSTYTGALTGSHTIGFEAAPVGANCAINVLLDGASIISGTEPETNLTKLGTGMGIRMQSGTGANWNNTSIGPVFTALTVGSIN